MKKGQRELGVGTQSSGGKNVTQQNLKHIWQSIVSHGKFGSHDYAFCKNNYILVQQLTFRPRLNKNN